MKKIILFTLSLSISNLFAQNEKNNSNELTFLKNNIEKHNKEIESLRAKIEKQSSQIEVLLLQSEKMKIDNSSLSTKIELNRINILSISKELGTKIQKTESTAKDSISKLDQDVNTNRLYWIIGTLATLFLGGIIYLLLGKRIANSKIDVETQIKNTKKSLEEESIKLDSKLVEVLDTQLKLKQEEKQIVSANSTTEIDHSLALKVADEIIRIQKNLQQMDTNTKGLKQLSASVKRIQDNFASNGYELVEMLGKEFNEGLKAAPSFISNEDIEVGKQIITRIIKPQVNYKGQMIQSAQIEVSVGE
jgi:hypothetical protein